MRVTGDEGPRSERAENAAVLVDAGGVVGASAHHGPRLHVGPCESEDVRGAGCAAGLINTLDHARLDAEVASEGRVLVERALELIFGREGQFAQVAQTDE